MKICNLSPSPSLFLSSIADRKVGRRGLGARLVRSPCLPRNWGKMKLTEQSDPSSPRSPRNSPSGAAGELRESCGQSPSGRFNELHLGLSTPLTPFHHPVALPLQFSYSTTKPPHLHPPAKVTNTADGLVGVLEIGRAACTYTHTHTHTRAYLRDA